MDYALKIHLSQWLILQSIRHCPSMDICYVGLYIYLNRGPAVVSHDSAGWQTSLYWYWLYLVLNLVAGYYCLLLQAVRCQRACIIGELVYNIFGCISCWGDILDELSWPREEFSMIENIVIIIHLTHIEGQHNYWSSQHHVLVLSPLSVCVSSCVQFVISRNISYYISLSGLQDLPYLMFFFSMLSLSYLYMNFNRLSSPYIQSTRVESYGIQWLV